ncbi:formamidopyrimidine-DNA glycosylase lyase mutM [Apiosordaria backusii]|uniref:Formamidopyrimidine-DNA glycosylase lyase mutM n=1 Tax=Apiosordaria backusii TaxID=314023 RepID=A0AA40EMZ4_9PEZI|nr:formamidopyrimidine-DNA glycosylase lyase mutM [Apiosordaria backusii]
MPEIAEVARIVHFLRLHLVGKIIKSASAIDDANVFGKVGTTGAQVAAALTGRKVVSSGSQGKLFWITLDKPPHLVMHFGMTGWISIRGQRTEYSSLYRDTEAGKEEWPPKFWKFHLVTTSNPPVEVAFKDTRRFGRVRLVDCPGDSIRQFSPLVENGPDPVVDTDRFTLSYFTSKCRARRVPIKALLLDQTVISGIGNWVADEVLFQSRLHPEQVCNSFTDDQVKTLFEVIRYVCQTAVDKLGDSHQFPSDWLFKHRWGKGGKATSLPNGEPLTFLTVGGRTSCFAPGLQKKTGQITEGAKEVAADDIQKPPTKSKRAAKKEEDEPAKSTSRKRKAEEDTNSPFFDEKPQPKTRRGRTAIKAENDDNKDNVIKAEDEPAPPTKKFTNRRGKAVKTEADDDEFFKQDGTVPDKPKPRARRGTTAAAVKAEKGTKDDPVEVDAMPTSRRRSTRPSGVY